MFSSLGLFKKTKCPDIQNCKRTTCIFSHSQGAPAESAALDIPIRASKSEPQPQKGKQKHTPSSSSLRVQTVPSKRTLQTTDGAATVEPPRKVSKVGPTRNPGAVPTLTQTPVSSKLLGTRTTVSS